MNLPNCVSFQNLYGFCSDPLVLAKFNFALAIAMIQKPFLTMYHTDKLLVFILARDLETLVRKLLTKSVKCSLLSSSTGIASLLRIDFEDPKNHIRLEKVDIGHTTEQVMKTSKLSAKDVFTFRMEGKQFLVSVTKKVLEKSPLRYPFVRGLSSMDPQQMCSKPDECLLGLEKVLDALIVANRLRDHQRDSVLAECTKLLQEQKHKLRLFEKNSDSLDEFFLNL